MYLVCSFSRFSPFPWCQLPRAWRLVSLAFQPPLSVFRVVREAVLRMRRHGTRMRLRSCIHTNVPAGAGSDITRRHFQKPVKACKHWECLQQHTVTSPGFWFTSPGGYMLCRGINGSCLCADRPLFLCSLLFLADYGCLTAPWCLTDIVCWAMPLGISLLKGRGVRGTEAPIFILCLCVSFSLSILLFSPSRSDPQHNS